MTDPQHRWFIAAAVATAACLPRGAPPAGRQIVADRQSQLGPIVAPSGDGVLRILVLRPEADASNLQDLFVVSVAAGAGRPSERLLAAGIKSEAGLGCIDGISGCGTDAKGRLWVATQDGYSRVDAITGDRVDLGSQFIVQISQSGDRFLAGGTGSVTLYDADGTTTTIDSSGTTYFVGEDLYYTTATGDLMHVPPSGTPARLASGVDYFRPWPTPQGVLLVLQKVAPDPSQGALDPVTGKQDVGSVLDPITDQETPSPFSTPYFTESPDGGWLVQADQTIGRLTFCGYPSAAELVVDLSQPILGLVSWSTKRSEVWVNTGPFEAGNAWVVTTDGTTTMLPGVSLQSVVTLGGVGSPLTADGNYWFSTPSPAPDSAVPIQVGAADDPLGPRVPLNPPGTNVNGVWSLLDGRLLTQVYTDKVQRNDVLAVDPRSGDSRRLAERGEIAAVGQTRLLGMFHFDETRGDLTVVALDSGQSTILAPEFTVTAFAEPQGADAVAPGTRIAYQFQARTASPYDGIWVVNSP